MRLDLPGEVMDVDDRLLDAGFGQPVSAWSSIALPPILTSGLGNVSVIGRMRCPRPAASTIARRIGGEAVVVTRISVSISLRLEWFAIRYQRPSRPPHRHCERSEAIQGRKSSTPSWIASSLCSSQ